MMAHDTQTSINVPQLVAVVIVGFLALRWFMSKPGPASSTGAASSRRQTVDFNKVEQVSAVFPQLDRRAIAWDLHRNGGNVEGTMERMLSGRGLDTPPPTFQPVFPTPTPVAGAASPAGRTSTTGATPGQAAATKPGAAHVDLITRYNLQSRISTKGKEPVRGEEAQQKQKSSSSGWSADKNARAEALRRRREEMVLAARRKMLEKDAAAADPGAASVQ